MGKQTYNLPDFTRDSVLEILRASFYRCANSDYANGYILHEEDVRASVYRYTREALDLVPAWRVFSNITAFECGADRKGAFKPDLTFFHSPDPEMTSATVEVFAEIKHWPDIDKIERDIQKLLKLRSSYKSKPTIAFFAILGTNFPESDAIQIEQKYACRYPDVLTWFRHHDELYRGPWDEERRIDPWRRAMRHL